MSTPKRRQPRQSAAKPRRAFWALVSVAVLAMGSLANALARPPSPWTGLAVAASGVVLLLASALAARVMAALGHRRRHESART